MPLMSEKDIAEIRAWRDRERAKNRAKAAKARERRAEAGLVQCNMWVTEDEAKKLKDFLAVMRGPDKFRVHTWRDGKWERSGLERV